MASPELSDLSERYWEARLRASPLFASFLGDHRFDDQADDISEAGEARHRAIWADLLEEAERLPSADLDPTDQVTLELLIGELQDAIFSIDDRLMELAADHFTGVHADLLTSAAQLRAPEPDLTGPALLRIDALAEMLDQAVVRFRAGVAAGRTLALASLKRSLNQLDGYLASDLDDDPFVMIDGPADWPGEAAWRRDLSDRVERVLRPAFARYRTVLAEELVPIARPDDRSGLSFLTGGDELYKRFIRLHTGLDLPAEELHEIGRIEVLESLPAEYAEIGERAFGTRNVAEIHRRILDDVDLRYRDGDEILAHAEGCLDAAQAVMAEWFGLLPEAPCVLTPVPDFLAADSTAAYYMPPAPDGSRPGEYFVNLHDPTGRSRVETAAIAFHEAIPGHHLQLAISAERTDLPAFRRLSWGQTAFVEGWALYTERLADEMGLYPSDLDRLGMLVGDSWRAGRLVVDTGLHALGWSRQQAIDFLTEHAPLNPEEVEAEIDRYIAMPGQALAYKVGQREILRLRAEEEARLGSAFSLPAFHDVVLGAATVSLPVLARRVSSWTGA